MTRRQDPQNDSPERGDLPDEAPEKALHDQKDHQDDDENIQKVHGRLLPEPFPFRQGQTPALLDEPVHAFDHSFFP